MARVEYKEKKLRELILYVATRSENDPLFGATKLNKILFFSDFEAYVRFGTPITGAAYQQLPQGPAPKQLVPVKLMMIREQDILEREVLHHSSYPQKRILALRDPDLSMFSAEEIALVEKVLSDNRHLTAKKISNKSHDLIGWKLANNGEEIPYQTALLHSGIVELTEEHMTHCKAVIDRVNAELALVA